MQLPQNTKVSCSQRLICCLHVMQMVDSGALIRAWESTAPVSPLPSSLGYKYSWRTAQHDEHVVSFLVGI